MTSASDVDQTKQTQPATEGRRVPPSTVFTRGKRTAPVLANAGATADTNSSDSASKSSKASQASQPALETKPTVPTDPIRQKEDAKPEIAAAQKLTTKPTVPQQPDQSTKVKSTETNSTEAESPKAPRPVRGGQGAAGFTNATHNLAKATIPRPESWEDDISRNTLDETPFTSLASPASRPVEAFEETARMNAIKPLLDGRAISEFVNKDTWPIPTPEDREGYSAGFDEAYWLSGLEDYLKIMKIAKQNGIRPKSMMDFGCATGRVVRHFAAHSDIPEIWGTDINQRHVRWLYEHLPMSVKPVFNHCIPTLPIADSSVDIITAFSVFTHIDTFETHWLAELSRIMSDDGMCYLTVHNEATWEALNKERDNEKNRLIQSIVKIDPEFKSQLAKPMPPGRKIYRFTQSGPYRAQVFHSDSYLRNVWGRFFDIQAIMPRHHVRQTVVVLRKKSK